MKKNKVIPFVVGLIAQGIAGGVIAAVMSKKGDYIVKNGKKWKIKTQTKASQ